MTSSSWDISPYLKNIQKDRLLDELLASFPKNDTVLITGAAGSIGSALSKRFLSMGVFNLVLIDHAETPLHYLELFIKENYPDASVKIKIFICNIRDTFRISQIFELTRPNIVFHAAAYKHVHLMEMNAYESIQTNVVGTKNVVSEALAKKVDTVVFISTDKAVNPKGIMGATKNIAEEYVRSVAHDHSSDTRLIITRFGNVAGSNGSIIPTFEKQILNGGPVTITDRNASRYFLHIEEATDLLLAASLLAEKQTLVAFDMGTPLLISDIIQLMIKDLNHDTNKRIDIKEVGLRQGEKMHEELYRKNEKPKPTIYEKIIEVENDIPPHAIARLENLITLLESKKLVEAKGLIEQLFPELSDIIYFD